MSRVLLALSAGGSAMRRTVAETIFASRDHALRMLAPDEIGASLRETGVPIEIWKPAGLFNVLRSIGALRRTVERFDPEVIHAFGWTAAAVTLGALPPRYAERTLVTLQDSIRDGEMPKPFLEKRLPELLPRAGWIACAYDKLQRAIVDGMGVPRDRIAIEPPGVMPLAPPKLARPPRRPGPIIGYVGALNAERGWELVLDALALLQPKYPDARVWFANDGRVRSLVKAHARSVGVINATTFYDDLPTGELFAGIDMLVVPRMRDGLPYPALEALASGIPLVASNVDGLADTLPPWACYLVNDDAASIATGIDVAWGEIDTAWEAAAEQRDRAAAAFDREVALARTFAHWERLASVPARVAMAGGES